MATAPATRATEIRSRWARFASCPTTGAYRSRITCALPRHRAQVSRARANTRSSVSRASLSPRPCDWPSPGSVAWSPAAHGVLRGTRTPPRRANRSSPLIAALGNERHSHAVGISAYDAFVRSSAREQEENAYARNPPSTRQSVPTRGDSGFAPSMGSSRSFLG